MKSRRSTDQDLDRVRFPSFESIVDLSYDCYAFTAQLLGSLSMRILGSVLSAPSKYLIGFVLGVLAAAACAIGFFALEDKSRTVQSNDPEDTTEMLQARLSDPPRPSIQVPIEQDSNTKTFFHESAFARDATLFYRTNLSSREDLIVQLSQFAKIESKGDRLAAQTITLRKLTSIDPKEALDQLELLNTLDSDSLLAAIYYEWSHSDLVGAVNEASQLSAPKRTLVLGEILRARDELSEAERFDIAQSLGGEDFVLEKTSETEVSRLIDEDPQRAWEFAMDDKVDDFAQIDLLVDIAQQWKEREGIGVLSHISEALAGYERSGILRYVVTAVSKSNHEEALFYAQGLPADSWSAVCGTIASSWARSNPEAALSFVSQVSDGGLRNMLQRSVVDSWATSDPRGMLEAANSLPKDLLQLGLASAFRAVADQDVDEAIRLMQSMENSVASTFSIARNIVLRWSDNDPDAALGWVDSLSALDTSQKRGLVHDVLSHLVHVDPKKAFELARQRVAKDGELDIESRLVGELVAGQYIDVALSMLPLVSDSARLKCFQFVASGLVRTDRPEEAFELANQLPESEKANYIGLVAFSWARFKPLELVESMDSLPSNDARATAAAQILKQNNREPILDDDQVKYMATYLNEYDRLNLGF